LTSDVVELLLALDNSPSPEIIGRLAASGDRHVVAYLLPYLACDEPASGRSDSCARRSPLPRCVAAHIAKSH